MYSAYSNKKNAAQEKLADAQHKKILNIANKHLKARNSCASQSQIRMSQWMNSNLNSKAAELLRKGCSSLNHPDLHNFRDYNAKASIYLRKYIPEKNRILLSVGRYFNEHYIQEPYNENAPNIKKYTWLKPRDRPMELAYTNSYKKCDENNRVNSAIEDHPFLGETVDSRLITNPVWRHPNVKKFMSTDGFATRLRTQFKGKFDDQAWNVHKNFAFQCKYKGGFEETGDLNRKRDKSRELSPQTFNAVNPEDTWKNRLNTSISLRTHKAEKAMREAAGDGLNESKKESFGRLRLPGMSSLSRVQALSSQKTPPASAKEDAKLYKKSLENHYFEYNSHPMKTEVAEREEAATKNLSISSARIFKGQLTTKHWTSDFNKEIDAAFELRQLNRIKTPLENFFPKDGLLSKSSTRSKLI
eukprot:TRINITY_DN10540_c0_g2_i1.p1 TRINITY_DN10540_c0_g2~~TRINITY_DN10540_c0_g2_i1.p1  ORF type:complete len:415 (-),score=92.83 TRINITY_DN10540_c0_g2_i1:73-1317(-)